MTDPAPCKWCNDGCGWYTSYSGGFARWVPCDHCNYDGLQKRDPNQREIVPDSILRPLQRCPNYPDFPTAWAIQWDRGARLEHHERCSSVPGWDPISGPALLCDCGAVRTEWNRLVALLRDSDRSGEAGETPKSGSTEGESAGPKDIARKEA